MANTELTDGPLLTRWTRRRALAVAVAGLTLVGGSIAASAAPNAQAITELPPVTISSTVVRADETISISGTGCLDPATGSGDGLEVVLLLPVDSGRGGVAPIRPTVHVAANADGSFNGSGVVEQPFFPSGAQTGIFSCQEKSEEGYPPVFAQREVQLTIEVPSLPNLTVAAGSTIAYELPCSILGGEYGRFILRATADGRADIDLSVLGSFPYETSPQEGQQVQLQIPADARPGVYDATATCMVSEAGTSAFFAGFTLTVTAGDPTASTPATPATGKPNYTG